MNKYIKITEDELLKLFYNRENEGMFYYGASIEQIANTLKTSTYQITKHIHSLRNKGFVKLSTFGGGCVCGGHLSYCECEGSVPYRAWLPTGKDISKYG